LGVFSILILFRTYPGSLRAKNTNIPAHLQTQLFDIVSRYAENRNFTTFAALLAKGPFLRAAGGIAQQTGSKPRPLKLLNTSKQDEFFSLLTSLIRCGRLAVHAHSAKLG
jgi:hypothetical protein